MDHNHKNNSKIRIAHRVGHENRSPRSQKLTLDFKKISDGHKFTKNR